MDFFAHQEAARRTSKRLVGLFLLAVASIVVGVYLVVSPLWLIVFARDGFTTPYQLWDLGRFLQVAAGVCTVIFLGSAYRIASLGRDGGATVARLLGGRLLDPDTRDRDERRLLNVVEEMAIASGIPVPAVYILDGEGSINAFAAGLSTNQAVIGVTRGCMTLLSRDELQGVIGHEFSHVLNGDMRLNLRLMGILHGILVIAIIGRLLMSGRRSRGKDAAKAQMVGLGLYVVGYAGVLFGSLIKAAVSRQREFLADASAVQFTRNPGGIAGALKKIGGLATGSRLATAHAEEASHLFFGDALRRGFTGWLSTHPPLRERVVRIDPAFDGTFPRVEPAGRPARTPAPARGEAVPAGAPVWRAGIPAMAGAAAGAAGGGSALARPETTRGATDPSQAGMDPRRAVERIGTLDRPHIEHAVALLEALGSPLLDRARSLPGALVVAYALAIGNEPEVRRRQIEILRTSTPPELHADLLKLLPALDAAPHQARLPLMDLAVSTLRRLSLPQFERFVHTTRALAEADQRLDFSELAMRRAVLRHVAPVFGGHVAADVRYRSLRVVAAETSTVLSALARCGQREPETIRTAFAEAAQHLGKDSALVRLLPEADATGGDVEHGLDQLAWTSPEIKRKLIAAATACVMWDRRVTMHEAELLRAFADALDCPVPPFIPGVEI